MFDAEYSDIVTLPPVRVDQEFVDDLIRTLRSNVEENKDLRCDITAKVGNRSFSRKKISDIVRELKSNDISELIISVHTSAKSDFDPWMTVSINQNRSIFQISSNNEIFFRGKINQIFDFFREQQPSYTLFKRWISICAHAVGFASAVFFGFFFLEKNPILLCGLALLTLASFVVIFGKDIIFPATIFSFVKKERNFDYKYGVMLLVTIIGTVATIVGVVIQGS